MSILDNSYGTVEGVAAYVRVYTNAGAFGSDTVPTFANVEKWINQISSIANSALADARFSVPITQPDSILMIIGLVEQAVADLCHAARSSGRFFSERALNSNLSAMGQLRKEIYDWVANNATGMENMGADRVASESSSSGAEMQTGVMSTYFAAHGNDLGITS